MAVRRNVILWAGRINAYVATILDHGSHVVVEEYHHVRAGVVDTLPATVHGRIMGRWIVLHYPWYQSPAMLRIHND